MQESTWSIIPSAEEPVSKQPLGSITPAISRQSESLRAGLPGLAVAVSTVLFAFVLGGVFGLNEDLIKSRLAASASAVTATVYHGDAAAAQPVLAKSWDYMQRAHLHGGAMGTAAIGLTVVMILLGTAPRTTRVLSLALGVGALGYAVFWMWAGFIAPGLGGTGAAKEALRWLAMPSAGAVMLATAAVAVLCIRAALRRGS